MILKQTIQKEMTWSDIEDAIRTGALKRGDLLEIENRTWKVLDASPGNAFIWQCHGPMDRVVFNESGSNEYEGSDIQKYARETFPAKVPEKLREMVTEEGFFPLSIEEVEKYLPTEAERIASDEDGETWWYWLRSAYRGSAYSTWYVNSSGVVYIYRATNAIRFSPACHLQVN